MRKGSVRVVGHGGPLHVSFVNYGTPISTYGQKAFSAAGFPVIEDFSNGVLNCSQRTPFTVNPTDGLRSSYESLLLEEMLSNSSSNSKVYQSTQAMNILFDGTKAAIGVNVSTVGMPYILHARKESLSVQAQ